MTDTNCFSASSRLRWYSRSVFSALARASAKPAWALASAASAWLTLAWNVDGSMRAMIWPGSTVSLKSTSTVCRVPDTWVPTSTVAVAPSVPVAEMLDDRSPMAAASLRYWPAPASPLPANWR